jgi:hypothetical protein
VSVVKVWGADAGDFVSGNLIWSALNALRPANSDPPSRVDLQDLQLARPYTLATIAALGCLAQRQAELMLPRTQEARDYVVRSGLLDFFTCSEGGELSESGRIVRVRQLVSVSSSFADEIAHAWEKEFGGMPGGLRARLADHLDEVIRNGLSHAESPIGCIVAATVYPRRREVELCVLDVGQTIRGHLTRNPLYGTIASDTDAILKATEEGVTGTLPGTLNRIGEPNSGVGLFELRSYCESGGGELTIASGGSVVSFATAQAPIARHFAGGFPGTLVNVRFTVW